MKGQIDNFLKNLTHKHLYKYAYTVEIWNCECGHKIEHVKAEGVKNEL